MLFRSVERCLAARGVSRGGARRVLLGCSGGPDSIALLDVLVRLYGPGRVVVGHVDHGVRAASGRDAAAVRGFAGSLGCDCHVARLEGLSEAEAALREARYAALEEMRQASKASFVLTAHTADDQAETVLMALLTRTHADALSGMPEQRGVILRPWLMVPRAEVHAHVVRHRLPALQDASNLEPCYLRNRLRKELLPLIEARYRPGFTRRLALLAGERNEGRVRPTPPEPPEPASFAHPMPTVRLSLRAWSPNDSIPNRPTSVVFDASNLEGLALRPLSPGDRIQPFGRSRPRKVRDVLREGGIIEARRRLCHVLVDDSDRVLWVPGMLRSDHARVLPSTTFVWLCEVDVNHKLRASAYRANLHQDRPVEDRGGREKSE